MTKIPVKIIELTAPTTGKKSIEVMIDVYDYHGIEDAQEKIKQFKKMYFELVKKAQKIMPKNKGKRKSSTLWKIGKLLYDFNKSIKNEFEITNYSSAIVRDFELSGQRSVRYILDFGEFFTESDISDLVPFSHYMILIDQKNFVGKSSFQKEKNRLVEMAKNGTLPQRDKYRSEFKKLEKTTN